MAREHFKSNAKAKRRLNEDELEAYTDNPLVDMCQAFDGEKGFFFLIPIEWAESMRTTFKRVDYGILVVMSYIYRWYLPDRTENGRGQVRFKGQRLLVSLGTISRETRLSTRQVSRNLQALYEMELIRLRFVEGRGYEIEPEIGNLSRLFEGKPLIKNPPLPPEWEEYEGKLYTLSKPKPAPKAPSPPVNSESIKAVDFSIRKPLTTCHPPPDKLSSYPDKLSPSPDKLSWVP